MSIKSCLVVTHIYYRKSEPFDPLEGPYSTICDVLKDKGYRVNTLQIPIDGYRDEIIYGQWKKSTKRLKLPSIFGSINPIKYLIDFFFVFSYTVNFFMKNKLKNVSVIAIDPLSCIPLILLKKIIRFKLVYYAVDFNQSRFSNNLLQYLYKKADEISSKDADQCWVVSQAMKDYKKKNFAVDAIHVSNSAPYDRSIYQNSKKYKSGNKLGWSGSFLTDKQFDILFKLLKKIQELRPDIEIHLVPTGKHDAFEKYGKKYKIKNFFVAYLTSRKEWQEYAAKLDLGIAIYDPDFGMTKFIEPLKIWDYLLCGLSFIISSEPTLPDKVKNSKVIYRLGPRNKIIDDQSLRSFIKKDNLLRNQGECLLLAKAFDSTKLILGALKKIDR